MNKITKELHKLIDKNGPISFKNFMEMALYYPHYGYYRKEVFPVGRLGDFVTSPHTNEIFGALIAKQLLQMKDILGTDTFVVVEMGAGAGYMALDILRFLEKTGNDKFFKYIIVEPFENNVSIQREILNEWITKIKWVSSLSDLKEVKGCFLSNELVDAFPVHLIQKEDAIWKELFLKKGRDGFEEVFFDIKNDELKWYCEKWLKNLPDGYRTEINLEIKNWITEISKALKSGYVITIDYGHTRKEYFNPARNKGTLLTYFRQQVSEDIYADPGKKDITAHVNFSDIHYWGTKASFKTVGYTSQCFFLAGQDIEEVIKVLENGKIDPFSPKNSALKSLLLPQGMGDSHKVLVQSKGVEETELNGFKFINKKSKL